MPVKNYLGECLLAITRNLAVCAAVNRRLLLLSHIMLLKNYARSPSNGNEVEYLTAGEDNEHTEKKRLIRRTR